MTGYTRYQAALWEAAVSLADRGLRIAMVRLGWDEARGAKTLLAPPPAGWHTATPFPSTQVKAAIDRGCNAYLWRLPDDWYAVDADTPALRELYTGRLGLPDVVTPRGAHWAVDAPAAGQDRLDTGMRALYGPGSHYLGPDGSMREYIGTVPARPRQLPLDLRKQAREFGSVTPGQPTIKPRNEAFSIVAAKRAGWLASQDGSRHEVLMDFAGTLARVLLADGLTPDEVCDELEKEVAAHPDSAVFETAEKDCQDCVRYAMANPWVFGRPPGLEGRFAAPDPVRPAEQPGVLPTLSGEFWESRHVLAHLRAAAWSRRLSPDAVLHAVLARLAAGRRAVIGIDSGIEDSSLNYFAAIIGASGAGKSRAWRLAGRLLDLDPEQCPTRPLGSGEGVSEAFMGVVQTVDPESMKTIKLRTQTRHNVLFELDEGQALTAMLQRTGATIGPALRSAWSGAVLGQQNADAERNRRVAGYATGLVAGFQPDAMQALIEDTHTGMPQRFAFAAAADPSLPRERPPFPGPLPVDLVGVLAGATANPFTAAGREATEFGALVSVPSAVTDELDAALLAVGTGAVTPPELDSQKIAMMLRCAGLLALLESRFEVTSEDWQLAGLLWSVSAAVRDAMVARAAERAERARDAADGLFAVRQARAAAAVNGVDKSVERVARRLALRVRNDDGLTVGEARRALASRDRHLLDAAVDYAAVRGWIEPGDGKLSTGDSRPD